MYFCLTEGSGGAAVSRMASTTVLLERIGATAGGVFGRYSDKDVYRLLLDGRHDVFVDLTHELAELLIAANIEYVEGDAVEGFNPPTMSAVLSLMAQSSWPGAAAAALFEPSNSSWTATPPTVLTRYGRRRRGYSWTRPLSNARSTPRWVTRNFAMK